MTARRFAGSIVVLGLALGGVVTQAGPAMAACASNPATNPITINHPFPQLAGPVVIPGIEGGMATVCADVTGNPSPQVDPDVTVDVQPTGCGTPCFVVEWDGVSTQAVTVSVSITSRSGELDFERTIPAGNHGSFCINAGQPCP